MLNFHSKMMICSPVLYEDGFVRVFRKNDIVEISDELVEPVKSLLEDCANEKTIGEIIETSRYDACLCNDILEDLIFLGAVCEQNKYSKVFHGRYTPYLLQEPEITCNVEIRQHMEQRVSFSEGIRLKLVDSNFDEQASRLVSTLTNRRSCRSFAFKTISLECLSFILRCAYSSKIKPVPSAGALYPLRIYVVTRVGVDGLSPGCYEYDNERDDLIFVREEVSVENINYVINSLDGFSSSSAFLVIGADLDRHAKKYSNRGYVYTLLEAGAVAQNISVASELIEIATCEIGGFVDDFLKSSIGMNDAFTPILVMAIGIAAEAESENDLYDYAEAVEDRLVGGGVMFNLEVKDMHDYGVPIFCAECGYGKDYGQVGYGSSTNVSIAKMKAIAEAYERMISETPKYDYFGSALSFGRVKWINPDSVYSMNTDLKNYLGLSAFDPKENLQWVKGRAFLNEDVYALVETVYYGFKDSLYNRKKKHNSTSSGCAAGVDRHDAERRAVLELIERDALMRLWFSQRIPTRINPESINYHFKNRHKYWLSQSRDLVIIDLSNEWSYVSLVLIMGSHQPYLCSGASASFQSFEDASIKALNEAEVSFAYDKNRNPVNIQKEDIYSPEDHGDFYAFNPESIEGVEFLFSGKSIDYKGNRGEYNVNLVNESLDAMFFELSVLNDPSLVVIRAISPKLVPISFGYKEIYSFKNLSSEIYWDKILSTPHFFS